MRGREGERQAGREGGREGEIEGTSISYMRVLLHVHVQCMYV